jgi:hypothetical protein
MDGKSSNWVGPPFFLVMMTRLSSFGLATVIFHRYARNEAEEELFCALQR